MAFCARTKILCWDKFIRENRRFFFFFPQIQPTTTTKTIATQCYVKIFMVILVTKIFSLTKETNQNQLYVFFLLPFPHCHMSLCPTSKYTTMTQKFVTNIKWELSLHYHKIFYLKLFTFKIFFNKLFDFPK